jgi:hypothetical protein
MGVLPVLAIAVRELEVFAGLNQLLIDAMLEENRLKTSYQGGDMTLVQMRLLPRANLIWIHRATAHVECEHLRRGRVIEPAGF